MGWTSPGGHLISQVCDHFIHECHLNACFRKLIVKWTWQCHKNFRKQILAHTMCLIKKGNDDGYMTCITYQSLINAQKMMTSK
jgi:hypothetical protein